jgi:hypothetical protein
MTHYKRFVICFVIFPFIFATGCGRKAAQMEEAFQDSLGGYSGEPAMKKMAPSVSAGDSDNRLSKADEAQQQNVNQQAQNKEDQRMRVYSGFARLVVDSVERQKEDIIKLAEESKGYVEGVYETMVVIRVPAARFDELFARVLSFGDVDFKSVETFDVTDAFFDLSSRLDIAVKARERLYTLLAKTEDVEERLKILREIRRLTEEIEQIKLTLEELDLLVEFSRIEVELIPRLAQQNSTKSIPFPWIAGLSPLNASITRLSGKVSFPLTDAFARFENERYYRAESATGVRLRCGSIANDPAGDAQFWQNALVHHLAGRYQDYERLSLSGGSILAVCFTSKDAEPFRYLVGVAVRKDRLYVIEVFFPSEGVYGDSFESVKTMIEGVILP